MRTDDAKQVNDGGVRDPAAFSVTAPGKRAAEVPEPDAFLDNWYFDGPVDLFDFSIDADTAVEATEPANLDIESASLSSPSRDGDDRFAFDATRRETGDDSENAGGNRDRTEFAADEQVFAPADTSTAPAVEVRAPDGAVNEVSVQLTAMPGDGLFGDQWHLRNTGQNGGQAGIDINVTGVWDDYTGSGIRVGVVDDGVQYTHHDLNDNYNASAQYDYGGNDSDPIATAGDSHGTAVAGLIAAENNETGTVGVAYDASVTAFRIFGGGITEAEYADVYNRHAAELDISNNSWGYNGYFYDNLDGPLFDSVGAAIENAAANGRDGLGTVMLWAAGNDRLSGQDVNYHGFQNARETIAVAAIDNSGEISFYSTPGAAILVGAPSNGGSAGIVTTDLLGLNGYAVGDYTYSFGGTSAATPITAGAVALILEANPLLGYRDVQEILAYSARQVDAGDPGWSYNGAHNWNGGGLHTSHDFGFGLIDTLAAVRLAETWTEQNTAANEATVSAASNPGATILDNSTITDQVFIGSGLDIEHVEVDLNLQHSWIGDLTITLTAPDGTQSILVDRPGVSGSSIYGTSQDNIDFTLSSTNHWGETGAGNWTLSVSDAVNGDQGTLVDWTLSLFGSALDNDDTYIYTDAFAGFAGDVGRTALSDASGTDAINAAAITSDSVIDLNEGGVSTLAGNTVTIASGTTIENAYGGDGADTLLGNIASNILQGGRGDDVLLGGAGGDVLDGGAGFDTASYAGAINAVYVYLPHGVGYWNDSSGDSYLGIERFVGGDGNDWFYGVADNEIFEGGAGNDNFYGADGTDVLRGDAGADTLFGETGADTLEGGEGDDLLHGGAGADVLDGGAGFDTVSYAGAINAVYVYLPHGVGYWNDSSGDSYLGIERFVGGDGNDWFYGVADAETFEGGAGNDHFYGADGADALRGDDGADTLFGEAGADTLEGGNGDDLLLGGAGADILDGGGGIDTVSYEGAVNPIYVYLPHGRGYWGDSAGDLYTDVERFIGGDGNDWFYGVADTETFEGGAGDDHLYGGAGDDLLRGDAGNDTLFGEAGADTLEGGDGDDLLHGGAGADVLAGGTGFDTVSYAGAVNPIYVYLPHGRGYWGDSAGDTYSGIERFVGGDGADWFYGVADDETFEGSAGNDHFFGGGGDDILVGGADNDVFVFHDNEGDDTIQDFAAGAGSDDLIDFSGVSGFNDLSDVQANATQSGADLTIDLGAGDSVTLIGVQLAALHEDDFIF